MKLKSNLQFSLTIMILFVLVVQFSSCKKDDGIDPKTAKIQKLSSTWKVDHVTNDNGDVTDQFKGFELTITTLNYTTKEGGNPWPPSGTYDFKSDELTTIVRSDGVELTIDELNENTLTLSFNFNTVTGGRLGGVTGDFTFSLTK